MKTKNVEKINVVKEESKKEPGVPKANLYKIINLKDAYLYNTLQGNYWLEVYNMLVDQLNGVSDVGFIDGVEKSAGLLRQEVIIIKHRVFKSYRQAYFNVMDLKELGVDEEELNKYVRDFEQGKAKRDKYDDEMKIDSKAGFVNV